MSRDTKALTKIIGIVYLCVGLAASPALVMYLLYVPKSVLASKPFLIHLGTLIVIYGPCFFIAYGWIRRRKCRAFLAWRHGDSSRRRKGNVNGAAPGS